MSFAVFGAGCFWCVEAIFSQLDGVSEVISGYTGGDIENPSYEQICSGKTNHAEVCKIVFDSKIISYEQLLKIFFETHDPTTLNKQGADEGTQYRSAIFYTDSIQQRIAIEFKEKLDNSKILKSTQWKPSIKIDKGLDITIDWYIKNLNWWSK